MFNTVIAHPKPVNIMLCMILNPFAVVTQRVIPCCKQSAISCTRKQRSCILVVSPGRGHRRIGSDEYSQIRSGSGTPTPRPASPAPMIGVPHVNTCPSNLNLASMMDTPIRPVPFKPTMGDGINRSVSWTSGIQQGSGMGLWIYRKYVII